MAGKTGGHQKTKTRQGIVVTIVVLAAAAIIGGGILMRDRYSGGAAVEVPTRPVETASVEKSLEAFRGKVVVLDFWATWCGPCRSEIPGLIALQNKYRARGLEIVGVSLDPLTPNRGGAPAVEPFMKNFGINYSIWTVNNGSALNGYDVSRGIPTKYIIDRNGRVVKQHIGAPSNSVVLIENDIKPLL